MEKHSQIKKYLHVYSPKSYWMKEHEMSMRQTESFEEIHKCLDKKGPEEKRPRSCILEE